jgi:hypothetical protein
MHLLFRTSLLALCFSRGKLVVLVVSKLPAVRAGVVAPKFPD